MSTKPFTISNTLLTLAFLCILLIGGGYGIYWSTTNMGTPGATFVAATSKIALQVVICWFIDVFLFSNFDTIHEVVNEQNIALALWEGAIFIAVALVLYSA